MLISPNVHTHRTQKNQGPRDMIFTRILAGSHQISQCSHNPLQQTVTLHQHTALWCVCVCVRERERQRDREKERRERGGGKGEGSGFLYSQSLLPESNQWGHGEELHSHVASLHRRKQHLTKQHITRSIIPHLPFLPPSLPRYYERLTQTSWLCESATKFLSSSE